MLCSACGRETPSDQMAQAFYLGDSWDLCHRDDEDLTCYMRFTWLHSGGDANDVTTDQRPSS
jgi:hypothetical protein